MKKGLTGFGIVLILVLSAVYFFIPATASFSYSTRVGADKQIVYRSITHPRQLQKWWAKDSSIVTAGPNTLRFSEAGMQFTLSPGAFDVVSVRIDAGQTPVQSFLTFLPLSNDSSAILWKAEVQTGMGFVTRIRNYFKARKVAKHMASVLERLPPFLQNEIKLFDRTITTETITDTMLVVTKLRDTVPPSVETYYGLLKKLRAYISAQGAQEVNYPMLNIRVPDSNHYETMVAIPVNKVLAGQGEVLYKRLVPGNILVTQVQGGPDAIKEGFQQMDFYLNDHRLRQQGLPFQSLVTDRMAEKDTTKWITKLYYPVM